MVFDVFNRQAEFVTMANIAQTINVLQCLIQTAGPAMWLTPTYHAYDLYKPHMGNIALRADASAARHEFFAEMEVKLTLREAEAKSATMRLLTSANADDVNSAEAPNKVAPVEEALAVGSEIVVKLPAKAVATVTIAV